MNQKRESLLNLFKSKALSMGEEITLASGMKSNVYVNSKKITLVGPYLKELSEYLLSWFEGNSINLSHVAGVSVGGDPIVSALAIEYALRGKDLRVLLIRKEKKAHGASGGSAVEGEDPKQIQSCWLIEDVVSTGGSSLKAAKFMLEEGYKIDGILCLLDRQMGGLEKLSSELNVPVHSLFQLSELK